MFAASVKQSASYNAGLLLYFRSLLMAVTRETVLELLDQELRPELTRDYCPNGLQVEGSQTVTKLVSGVTACQALIDCAVEAQADAILVHHGFFWRGEDSRLIGMKAARVRALMQHDINLFAYHLPMDLHPTMGNNAGLGRVMGVEAFGMLDPSDHSMPVFVGDAASRTTATDIAASLELNLGRSVTLVGEGAVSSIGWCTGGGQGYIDAAADAGCDLFVSGEMSEQTVHVARERGIAFIAAGHHATERFGPQSIGQWLGAQLGIDHQFVDINSPA